MMILYLMQEKKFNILSFIKINQIKLTRNTGTISILTLYTLCVESILLNIYLLFNYILEDKRLI